MMVLTSSLIFESHMISPSRVMLARRRVSASVMIFGKCLVMSWPLRLWSVAFPLVTVRIERMPSSLYWAMFLPLLSWSRLC